MGIDSENAWYFLAKKNYCHLFLDFCSRTRFNRTRRNLLQVTELLREKLLLCFPELMDNNCVIDSFPLAVCKFGRARYCRSFKENMADYGKCPSKKLTSASKSMPWLPCRDISQPLKLHLSPLMTGRGCWKWQIAFQGLESLLIKGMQAKIYTLLCRSRVSVLWR